MYLKIVLRYLDIQRAQENQVLHFQENLPEVSASVAEKIMKNLNLQVDYKGEIRSRYVYEGNKIVGMLVSIVYPETGLTIAA